MKMYYYYEVLGDMTADSAADQYPTVAVCEDCIKAQVQSGEDNQLVSGGTEQVADHDETCHFCDCGFDD